jgi:hypothetical protein
MMKIGAFIIALAVMGMLAGSYGDYVKKPPAAQQQTAHAQQKQPAQQKQ